MRKTASRARSATGHGNPYLARLLGTHISQLNALGYRVTLEPAA